ncbi:TRAFs-binding domain-containing protein [Blastomonas fulva]|jgi:adenylate cyclase|uniref:TRAFs-binding domain-containing protein n=1 Tax=Blastomonas fulva TaxID=1550728 RepID=UPI003D29195A
MTTVDEILSDPDMLFAAAQVDRANGDVLAAFDLVRRGKDLGTRSIALDYLLTRLMTELGDFEGALELYDALGLAEHGTVDSLSLKGRILKEQAFLCSGESRAQLLRQAADVYQSVYVLSQEHYPAINAASLMMMTGQISAARVLAAKVRDAIQASGDSDYWTLASDTEACLLLGDELAAECSATQLGDIGNVPFADRASTIRQFRRLGDCPSINQPAIARLIEALRPPPVIAYCGHMFVEGCDAEAQLRERIDAALDEVGTSIAYGPLACGADILFAEAVLERGGELNIVLPFREPDFIDQSVRCGGEGWVARFRACRNAANSVVFATESAFVGDDNQFAYGTRVMMGLAEIRARQLETVAIQLAVLDDNAGAANGGNIAGTRADVAFWEKLGRRSIVIAAGPVDRRLEFPRLDIDKDAPERGAYSILFADYKGFSKLGERELPHFAAKVMGTIGEVLDDFGQEILFRNTWGDAVYVVIASPATAARVAIVLQERLATPPPELASQDTGSAMGMRIGVHHGPIYKGFDRVVKQPLWFGTEVTRTARIEPVTPTGAVYCTDAFAAMLAIDTAEAFTHHYVGRVELAKGYGQIGMYRLVRVKN